MADLITDSKSYQDLLGRLKNQIRTAQVRAAVAVNRELVLLYWHIGKEILTRQQQYGWGAKIIDQLGNDLRQEFPSMQGFSPRNLKYMKAFADAWPDEPIVQQLAAQLPWFHNCVLIDKVKDPAERTWYIQHAIQDGWSRNVLVMQIESGLYHRQGKALTNFQSTLPKPQSDLAQHLIKDPYNFDFLTLTSEAQERDLERGLLNHLRQFLIELGTGFAFARDRKTFLVPTDSGVVMVQNVTKHPVRVGDYAIAGYKPNLDPVLANDSFQKENFGTRKYTSIADLKMAARLARLPQLIPASFEIRFGRDLRIEDLKHSNAILVGGPQGNPWVELFDKDLNFSIETDDYAHTQTVINHAPLPGEQASYYVQEGGVSNYPVYSIVSLTSNLDHTGRVLTIAGTTMAGIDAASEFLFNDDQFNTILREAQNPDGTFRRFEILLGTVSISSNALNVSVLAKRFKAF